MEIILQFVINKTKITVKDVLLDIVGLYMPPATHQPYTLCIIQLYGGRNENNPPTLLETLYYSFKFGLLKQNQISIKCQFCDY